MATEKRLIDAEPICDKCGLRNCYNCTLCNVGTAPTVDAVEVVRCKDCKHFIKEEHGCDHHGYFYPVRVMDNDFCSYGERKEK